MTKIEAIKYICSNLSTASIMEQCAEEAAEMAKAYLKWARVERGENPSPVTFAEAWDMAADEEQDFANAVTVLSCKLDPDALDDVDERAVNNKIFRWAERIREKQEPKTVCGADDCEGCIGKHLKDKKLCKEMRMGSV